MDKKILFIIILFILFIGSGAWLVMLFLQNQDCKDNVNQCTTDKEMLGVEKSKLTLENSELSAKLASLNIISANEAGQKAIDYINKNYGTKASLISIKETSGVYEAEIKFNSAVYTSYVTKDGMVFFTEGISLNPSEDKEFIKTTKPTIDLFVMSFCPFGNQAETTMMPVVDLLEGKISVNLHYIFYSNYGIAEQASKYCYDAQRKYCSMHGIQELNQDIREMCVAKYSPDKLWSFVKEINEKANSENADSKWEAIASGLGIDVLKIKDCYKNEATKFLSSELALTEKNYPVQSPTQNNGSETTKIAGSPTFVINGMIYSGSRTSEDIKNAICSAFKTAPSECKVSLSVNTSATNIGSCE